METWGVSFARYADDLTLFAESEEQAHELLHLLDARSPYSWKQLIERWQQ